MSDYIDTGNYPMDIVRAADIDSREKHLYVGIKDLRCELCNLTPRHFYDDSYLCTLHFHQLRDMFNELAKRDD